MQSKTLLKDVLRSQGLEQLTSKLQRSPLRRGRDLESDDWEDELIAVLSLPGTPSHSRSTSRATSPSRASSRRIPGPLHLNTFKNLPSDPLRAFPTEISQRIFLSLNLADLSTCAQVSKRWNRSQTLNYVWFRHSQGNKLQDQDQITTMGKWTRRESKINWRQMFKEMTVSAEFYIETNSGALSGSRGKKWEESDGIIKPDKQSMREKYRELGGRKPRTKGRLATGVGGGGHRDRGGWEDFQKEVS